MAIVNPNQVNALTGRVVGGSPNIGGAIGQGLQNAAKIESIRAVREQRAAEREAGRRQAEIQRILSTTPPEQLENAFFGMGMPDKAMEVGKFFDERQSLEDEARSNADFRLMLATDPQFRDMSPAAMEYIKRYPDKAGAALQNVFFPESKAPEMRTIVQGDKQIQQEWSPDGWQNVGEGPRWRPDAPGTVIYDPATGNPIATIGGAPINTKTQNDIGTAAFNASNILARLDSIASSYDRRFLETGTRTWAVTQDLLDKFNAGTATPDEAAFLNDMTGFYTDAFNNLNLTLKELSGAAVNEHEMKRLTQELPTPGELKPASILSGDGPRRFAAKLQASIRRNRLAIARYNYFLNTGRIEDFEEMKRKNTLPDLFGEDGKTGVDRLIERRGKELEEMYQQNDPNATQDQIATWVSQRLSQEFGLRIGAQ